MAEQNENLFDSVIDSFWACFPEETAGSLATFKKDVLTGFRSAVDSFVDTSIAETDRHLENARRKREEWRAECSAEPTDEAPPNPA